MLKNILLNYALMLEEDRVTVAGWGARWNQNYYKTKDSCSTDFIGPAEYADCSPPESGRDE